MSRKRRSPGPTPWQARRSCRAEPLEVRRLLTASAALTTEPPAVHLGSLEVCEETVDDGVTLSPAAVDAVLDDSAATNREIHQFAVAADSDPLEPTVAPLRNPLNRYDVSANRQISIHDLLIVVNGLLAHGLALVDLGTPAEPPYVDVTGDNRLDTLDVLWLVNTLLSDRTYYEVQIVQPGADREVRLFQNDFHYATFLEQPDGAVIFRPHPGEDPNGWGTSLFVAPFIGGEGSDSSLGAITQAEAVRGGILIQATGSVSGLNESTFGTWQWEAVISYKADDQLVTSRDGALEILLSESLHDAGGDLNLYRANSNRLVGVPLQDPPDTTGNTGDMRFVDVRYAALGDARDFRWVPEQTPNHFPTDQSGYLQATIAGDRNVVSTLDQGLGFQIKIAEKPTLIVELISLDPQVEMAWGGTFDENFATDFAADNVGALALVLAESTDATSLLFDVALRSTPPNLAN